MLQLVNGARPATHREVLASRCVAVTGAVAAALHVPLAIAHAAVSLPLAGLLVVVSLVCLPCAGHLWRTPSPRTWTLVVAAGTAMLIGHGALLLLPGGGTTAVLAPTGHAGHATAVGAASLWHGPGVLAVVTALSLVQVATCGWLLAQRCPPETSRTSPVTHRASSEARKVTTGP